MRKLMIAAAAMSLAAAVAEAGPPAEAGSRKRGKDRTVKREPHAASIAKPKSESLQRMLRKAKARRG